MMVPLWAQPISSSYRMSVLYSRMTSRMGWLTIWSTWRSMPPSTTPRGSWPSCASEGSTASMLAQDRMRPAIASWKYLPMRRGSPTPSSSSYTTGVVVSISPKRIPTRSVGSSSKSGVAETTYRSVSVMPSLLPYIMIRSTPSETSSVRSTSCAPSPIRTFRPSTRPGTAPISSA